MTNSSSWLRRPARAATSHSRQDTQGLQRITTLWVVIGPVVVGFRCAPIALAISNPGENRLFPVCSLSLAMNKRDRNGNSSAVATVLRDGQTVSTTAYQWAVSSSRLSCLFKNIGVRPRCAAPRARYIGSRRSEVSPTCHGSRPTCRCAGAAVPARACYSSSIAGSPVSNCPACKANLSSSRRWVAGNALSRTTRPAGSLA